MTARSYTSGPWSTFERIPGVYAESGREIVWHGHMTRSAQLTEQLANARLIAAAPDLHAALRDLLAWLIEAEEEKGAPLGVGYRASAQKNVVMAQAAEALRKVEGR